MSSSASPTAEEILQAIADLLTAKQSSAALAHYPTLRIQTNNLRAALENAVQRAEFVLDRWSIELNDDMNVAPEFQAQGTALFPYRKIAPSLVHNLHQTADFLLEETCAVPAVDIDQVSVTTPSFSDFVKLGAAVRSFLDALVQAAYQLATWDGLQLNYKFLQSLLSFAVVAPPSLHSNIVSTEMQVALDSYVALSNKIRKNSTFTKATHDQFVQRLDVVCKFVELPDWRRQNLGLLFGFCSDFVHSGYVSVLAIKDPGFQVILGGRGDAFTPRAENFAELKLQLIAECAGAYTDLLVPVLLHAIGQTLKGSIPPAWKADLDAAVTDIGDVRAILHRQLVEPIREGVVGSEATVQTQCMCGAQVDFGPPFHVWDQFCYQCGSRFVLHEVGEEVDYVVSQAGVGNVLGGDATKITMLSSSTRAKLDRIAASHAPKDDEGEVNFLLITDLDRCDEESLEVPSLVTSAPSGDDRRVCQLFAFVAAKSLERCEIVRIHCNCGAEVDYVTANNTNICQCAKCQRVIGLMGASGHGTTVAIRNPDGIESAGRIQAQHRFKIPGVAVD